MRILFVCNEYPPLPYGGFGIFVKTYGEYLAQHGHKVGVFGWHTLVKKELEYEENGLFIKMLPEPDKYNPILKLSVFARKLSEFEKSFKADVVEFGDTGGLFLFYKHKNVIVRLHNGERYFKERSRLTRILESLAFLTRQVKIVAVSGFIRKKFKSYFKLIHPKSNIGIVYNGTTIGNRSIVQGKSQQNKEIIFAGTLKPIKGVAELIKGFQLSGLHTKGFSLHIYGKDTLFNNGESYWESIKKQVRPADAILYHGQVPREKMLKKFSHSFLNIFPSYMESFGLVAIESMSVGGITIFTDQGAAREIISDGKDGFLLASPDPEIIAKQLRKISSLNPSQLLQIRNNAVTKAHNFSIHKTMTESIKIYLQ